MKSVSQCVAEFMRSQEVVRLAPATRKRQTIVLNLLIKGGAGSKPAIEPSKPIGQLDQSVIDEALFRVNHLMDSTLNAYRTDLRRFGKWLVDRGHRKTDPTTHLRNVKAETVASKRRPVANDKAGALLLAADVAHPRDGMTAMLMIFTGLRESEIVELKWRDLDLDSAKFSAWRSKNRDWHRSFLAPPLLEALRVWKTWVEERNGPIQDEWFVVPARAHRYDRTGHHRMNPEWPIAPNRRQTNANKRVKLWLEAIGETDLRGRSSHTLRRTAANLVMSRPGATIRTAQTLLGHKTAVMTENYLDKDVAKDQLQSIMQHWTIDAVDAKGDDHLNE